MPHIKRPYGGNSQACLDNQEAGARSFGGWSVVRHAAVLPAILGCASLAAAQYPATSRAAEPKQAQAVRPFKIVDGVYYVGDSDLASYLIVTPAGLILLDGGRAQTAEQIESNIRALGYNITQVKILLNGHAHPDHAGGLAKLKRDSDARFEAMDAEVEPLEHEGRGTFYRGSMPLFDSIGVDEVLHDGSEVALGGVRLSAHRTPGHTPGCTTWTMKVQDGGVVSNVVFACQLTAPDDLVSNPLYPDAAADFERSFALLLRLPCDVLLGEHGAAFDLQAKMLRLSAGAGENPFIDAGDCRRHLEAAAQAFRRELDDQRRAQQR